jgi:predicted SAM-dependent methyltransferase
MYRKNIIDHACMRKTARDQLFDETTFPKRVNLGCGVDYLEGWTNVDGNPEVVADIHLDLDDPSLTLPWENDQIHLFYASHLIEHIRHLARLKDEMIRCLEPKGIIVCVCPNFDSMDAWGDDTHVRGISVHSFFPDYWPGCNCVRTTLFDVHDSLGNTNKWIVGIMQKSTDGGVVHV